MANCNETRAEWSKLNETVAEWSKLNETVAEWSKLNETVAEWSKLNETVVYEGYPRYSMCIICCLIHQHHALCSLPFDNIMMVKLMGRDMKTFNFMRSLEL